MNTDTIISMCRESFSAYDELWLVSARRDHCDNLIDLGIVCEDDFTVVHTHNDLGRKFKNSKILTPPKISSKSFDGIFSVVDDRIFDEVDRVIRDDLRVAILASSPNKPLSDYIKKRSAWEKFTITSPVDDFDKYIDLENKTLLEDILSGIESKLGYRILAESKNMSLDKNYHYIQKLFNAEAGESFFVQEAVSAAGGGTYKISNQSDFNRVQKILPKGMRVKVSTEIANAYSANGSLCIVPRGAECMVFVDPLSHKVLDADCRSNGTYCSVGNGWGINWPKAVNSLYMEIAKSIGEILYKKYGYSGIVGVDFLVKREKNEYRLYVTEINPRWQGTTLYQTYNAILSNRIPLELIHYILKLSKGGANNKVLGTIGSSEDHNVKSVSSPGVYYLKLYAPRELKLIKSDMNGRWNFKDGNILNRQQLNILEDIKKDGGGCVVYIKSPSLGSVAYGEFSPIGYIFGKNLHVFKRDKPGATSDYSRLINTVSRKLYGSL